MSFDRRATLALINHDPILTEIYKGYIKEYNKGATGFNQEAVDKAIEKVYDERIGNPISARIYSRQWEEAKKDHREYADIPGYTLIDELMQKLLNVHGWGGIARAIISMAKIKQAELQNGGFDRHVIKWMKIEDAMRKILWDDIMS